MDEVAAKPRHAEKLVWTLRMDICPFNALFNSLFNSLFNFPFNSPFNFPFNFPFNSLLTPLSLWTCDFWL